MTTQGALLFVLHAHLPWVRHPEYARFMEEDWLYEAMSETYLPLLAMMDRLSQEQIPFALTMSLTPPLCEMLSDPLLQARYAKRLDDLIALGEKVTEASQGSPFESAAFEGYATLCELRSLYRQYQGRILDGFAKHAHTGQLEILTCGATHGLLALTATPEARHAQLAVAVANYEKHFGRRPEGIWLGECAYQAGLDQHLADNGLRYMFLETHGLLYAEPPPRFGHYRPILSEAGVVAFGRDPECSRQVWSAESGYPGDPTYREFYRDAGWDVPREWLNELLGGEDTPRANVGFKLHRITGKVELHQKEPYIPGLARARALEHAQHFLEARKQQLTELNAHMGVTPLVVAPYDAELFGHWWYEGPLFIEALFRQAQHYPELQLVTPRQWLTEIPEIQVARPAPSSWGDKGYWDVWLNPDNAWMYRHLHRAEEAMRELAGQYPDPSPLQARVLAQLGRELLLAQASDWAFIVTMKTTVPYAFKRTRLHLSQFAQLLEQLQSDAIDMAFLEELEARDNIFPELDYRSWKPLEGEIHLSGVSSVAID